MTLTLDKSLALGYTSKSQIARRITEDWMEHNMFCPVCGGANLSHLPVNSPVGDFSCGLCGAEFELKSQEGNAGTIGRTIPDGAFQTMINRITSRNNPHLFVMMYADWSVNWLQLIPNFLFVPSIIKKRKPLGPTARRAGWVGCNIAIGDIPSTGKINVVWDSRIQEKHQVLSCYQTALALNTYKIDQRGWLFDVLKCIEHIQTDTFSIEDVYYQSEELSRKYPNNNFIKPKVRQQLQRLRDRGFLSFLGHGIYRKTNRLRPQL